MTDSTSIAARKPILARASVRAWSLEMARGDHREALSRLVRANGPLLKAVGAGPNKGFDRVASIIRFNVAVVLRMFTLAGGPVLKVDRAHASAARLVVDRQMERLGPIGPGFVEGLRTLRRAQPHLVEEAIDTWFVGDVDRHDLEFWQRMQIFLAVWTAIEAANARWLAAPGLRVQADEDAVETEDAVPRPAAYDPPLVLSRSVAAAALVINHPTPNEEE